mmetsp:Transcript_30199/g.78422  ORF Transcript_30199/g.78422 Transcript_30199/m.78422 type:complete len:227 (+) Transcript_30199:261-941(+)
MIEGASKSCAGSALWRTPSGWLERSCMLPLYPAGKSESFAIATEDVSPCMEKLLSDTPSLVFNSISFCFTSVSGSKATRVLRCMALPHSYEPSHRRTGWLMMSRSSGEITSMRSSILDCCLLLPRVRRTARQRMRKEPTTTTTTVMKASLCRVPIFSAPLSSSFGGGFGMTNALLATSMGKVAWRTPDWICAVIGLKATFRRKELSAISPKNVLICCLTRERMTRS